MPRTAESIENRTTKFLLFGPIFRVVKIDFRKKFLKTEVSVTLVTGQESSHKDKSLIDANDRTGE